MNESGSSRVRAMSKLMTPSVARAAGMISASTAISSSLFSGLECTLNRRMIIGPPVDERQLVQGYSAEFGPACAGRAAQRRSPALTPGQRRRRRHLAPRYVQDDMLDIQWKLYELGGRFYRGRPKDGSIRAADLPPFLAEL